ncbi:MAG: thiamine phosphate synthase [Candidatus Altiarchaeota archaeon]
MKKFECGFFFITDRNLSKKGDIDDVQAALKAGIKVVQYREKEFETRAMVETAKKLKSLCEKHNALFILNDRIDVALAVDADGVHVGQDDMPLDEVRRILGSEKIIGVTVHNVEEAIEAESGGADYLGVSPIFQTDTKKDAGPAVGVQLIKKIKEKTSIPLIGIGGITLENLDEVIRAGADGVCAISATVASDNVESAVAEFRRKINDSTQ